MSNRHFLDRNTQSRFFFNFYFVVLMIVPVCKRAGLAVQLGTAARLILERMGRKVNKAREVESTVV
jgi:hypothetical protein